MREQPSASEAVCTLILTWAANQGLITGSRLPPERLLADLLGVPRTAINRALAALIARGVICQKSREIRVWIGDQDTTRPGAVVIVTTTLANPPEATHRGLFGLPALYQGAVDELRRRALPTVSISPNAFLTQHLSRMEPRGMLIVPDVGSRKIRTSLFAAIQRTRIPVVLFADTFSVEELGDCRADALMSDHAAGAEALVRHLHARGRRRIRICLHREIERKLSTNHEPWLRARLAGWTRACAALGLPIRLPLDVLGLPFTPDTDPLFDTTVRLTMGCLVESLLGPERPDGLLVLSDGLAFAIAAACRRLGIVPGRDIDIVGYDNYAHLPFMSFLHAYEPTVPHATIECGMAQIGAAMVKVLCGRAAGQLPPAPVRQVMPVQLIAKPVDAGPAIPAPRS